MCVEILEQNILKKYKLIKIVDKFQIDILVPHESANEEQGFSLHLHEYIYFQNEFVISVCLSITLQSHTYRVYNVLYM